MNSPRFFDDLSNTELRGLVHEARLPWTSLPQRKKQTPELVSGNIHSKPIALAVKTAWHSLVHAENTSLVHAHVGRMRSLHYSGCTCTHSQPCKDHVCHEDRSKHAGLQGVGLSKASGFRGKTR